MLQCSGFAGPLESRVCDFLQMTLDWPSALAIQIFTCSTGRITRLSHNCRGTRRTFGILISVQIQRLFSLMMGVTSCYWDSHTGGHITSAASVKDIAFEQWSCVHGWAVQGVWPPN